jgi:anti-sigma regulatory factor (Ser/Thr protein kinase)
MRNGEALDPARARMPDRRKGPPRAADPAPVPQPLPPAALDVHFDARGLRSLRAAVAASAARLAGEAVAQTVVIVAYELAGNAVRHGGGRGRLRLWRADDRVWCRVSDHGPGLPDPVAGSTPPAPTVVGGRGLWIVRALAAVDVATGPGGTTVTAAVPAP